MFELTQANFFAAFTLIALGLITILWLRELRRQKRYEWSLTLNRSCTCQKCQLTFLMKNNSMITRCPRCNNICILKKRG